MLTKDDYKHYLDQMRAVETKMAVFYKDLAERLDDADLKAVIAGISIEEGEHARVVADVAKTLLGRMT